MSRSRVCARWRASRCRAKSACNGGAKCSTTRNTARSTRYPVVAALKQAVRTLPAAARTAFKADGSSIRFFDLYDDAPLTLEALESYINDTASALFSLGAAICGRQSDEIEHLARHAGLAQGIAQMIAALPLDASRRQLFVPLQLLQQYGSGIEEVFAGKETLKLRAALDQMITEARGHLKTAFALLADAPPVVKPVFLPLALVRRDLQRMSRADNDPFAPHVTSRLRTLWTLWRAARSKEYGG